MRWVLLAALLAGCADDDPIADGKQFVKQRGCPDCHQSPNPADGVLSGQTTPQKNTMAYGANLTPDVMTGLGAWADIEIVRAMRYGIDNQQMPLCPPMPRFDGTDPTQAAMTDLEAYDIVAYLRSLPAVSRVIPDSVCDTVDIDQGNPLPADLAVAGDAAIPDGGASD